MKYISQRDFIKFNFYKLNLKLTKIYSQKAACSGKSTAFEEKKM